MALKEAIEKLNKAVKKADEVAKKLTTKDRKKLKSTTFCGPNRSFPVPDCQHVATAKAYLNRSKFSAATKKRIAACINRKSKALGCKPGKPAKAKGSLADSKIFKTTRELVDASIENEDLELNFTGCTECE
jgi:hypothetical protein